MTTEADSDPCLPGLVDSLVIGHDLGQINRAMNVAETSQGYGCGLTISKYTIFG